MRRRIVWALGVLLIAECIAVVYMSPALTVRRVTVRGLSTLTPDEVRETQKEATVPPGTNLFRARIGELVSTLKRLPWIADASVARRPPGTLEARVTPRVPVALLATPSGRWEMDAAGIPIRSARAASGMPVIEIRSALTVEPGVQVADSAVGAALFVARESAGKNTFRVAKIEVDQNADICLNMQDNFAIRLGQVEDLPAKLALIHRIYAEAPGIGAEVQVIDLRCPEAPACVPRSAGKEAPQKATPPSRQLHR